MALTMRQLRLRTVWLIVIPFFVFARPTATTLAAGGGLALLGLWIRGWSAGTIHKDRELTTSGPYAFTRNPLYLGSFFIGLGVAVAGGHWIWPLVFLLFYATVYTRTMAGEARHLAELFPERYPEYAARVPGFLPRLTPYRGGSDAGGFRWEQYRRNREWEAALGALAAFLVLAVKVYWS
ncbi:MAG: isoprenylcysteine carboxylmethyltransferase family protein [Longimicrobiales bacterium]|nr:isoprenylcysteine carboxylmethyltransferase family protein [Longimicrobiales bacterium]